jgi:hypothetical protein
MSLSQRIFFIVFSLAFSLTLPDYVDARRPPSEAATSKFCSQLS